MQPLLDPKNDYVFKRLFADAPELLAALINAVRYRSPPVKQVSVRNPAINAEELHGKYIILDLLVVDTEGRRYNIEMQVRRLRAMSARSTFYLARLLTTQLVVGNDYRMLKPAIGIHLLDFDLFQAPEHRDQPLWCFELRDAARPEVRLGDELQLNLVELRKADRLGNLPSALTAWIKLFRHWQEEEIMSDITEAPVRALYGKLQQLSADEEAQRLAFVRERALLDEQTLLNEAREEGREEGLREVAINMIRTTALDDAAIAAITGIAGEEVAALRRDPTGADGT